MAGMLTPEERVELEGELQRYVDSTSNDFLVLIIPSLQGESVEEYANVVAQKNGIGLKGRDNGLLLLISKEDRKVRIEVGYGLEPVLTDAMTRLVIENEITPRFKQGDFFGGIQSGLRALMLAAAGEYQAEPKSTGPEDIGIGSIIIFIIVIFVLMRLFRGGGGRRGGGGGGLIPWIIMSNMGGRSRGGWGGGSIGGGGGGWGGGGSSGGWSGGGGSFGGGGSTGSW
jgi:uncharacterized protein